jgi:CMP/dCMP kinase
VIIVIDGPAGAGKSSVARAVADHLGFELFDTGSLYRAAALAVLEAGLVEGDDAAIEGLLRKSTIETSGGRVILNGRDVSDRIRDGQVTDVVPWVSALPGVRAELVGVQRAAAQSGDVVMEGRDLGTVVVPDADLKVFLTASLDERARRRARQVGVVESGPEFDAIRRSIQARDETDSTRGHSPLKRAPDAVLLDSTTMPEEKVVQRILELAGGLFGR